MKKKIGENDKCEFYHTDRCDELEQERTYIEKYGVGFKLVKAEFKNPKDKNELLNEYLIIVDGNTIGVMTERTEKGQESLLKRICDDIVYRSME